MSEADTILTGSNIVKTYPQKDGEGALTVLDDVSLSIARGSIVSVIGASGSGKSTLLHVLGGLDKPDSGTVSWNDHNIYTMDDESLAEFRNTQLGFVFQFHHLLPEFTAIENIMMPALISGTDFSKAKTRASELMEQFGIPARAEHRPTQLSGGEQQRVAMARALMNNPKLILADEPTGNLDEENTDILLDMLFKLRELENVSILLITHEKDIAKRSDVIYQLSKGNLHPF
ncbi:ABC transporter ATP-binding protein [Balneolaceae bacterium YR4-1]|uniref:ABC transporter ATP-binding protein n=1 Tax=Halalkalibaculum roseum TaxID=2709311 RepID=A0A6M1SMP2_9BACT|nr:ABC transporter ATP-binding protein [Halalkalibaculum roseum]NGP76601.1 ABC transporter ATP-binding protein [Halalkalibaculum roseum]